MDGNPEQKKSKDQEEVRAMWKTHWVTLLSTCTPKQKGNIYSIVRKDFYEK